MNTLRRDTETGELSPAFFSVAMTVDDPYSKSIADYEAMALVLEKAGLPALGILPERLHRIRWEDYLTDYAGEEDCICDACGEPIAEDQVNVGHECNLHEHCVEGDKCS